MEQDGFTFKDGKYICVKAPGQQKNVKLKTLGDNYTPERIEKRIAEHKQAGVAIFAEQFRAVGIAVKQTAGAYSNTSTLNHINSKFMQIYTIIMQEKIGSIGALQRRLASAEKKYSELSRRVRELKEKVKGTDNLSEQLARLNDQLSAASKEVRKYKALSDIYDKMTTKEDYISRLVREAKDRTTSEEWNNMIDEQQESILSELESNNSSPMTVMEKKLRDKLLKLRTMNVEPHEIEQIIRALAVMQIEKISDVDTAHRLSGRMKASAENKKPPKKKHRR